jgi:hypothetical protein
MDLLLCTEWLRGERPRVSQGAFGGWRLLQHARIRFNGHAQRAAKRLEQGFSDVMRIMATQGIEVQGDVRVVDQSLKEFVKKIDVKAANLGTPKIYVHLESRTTRAVDYDA